MTTSTAMPTKESKGITIGTLSKLTGVNIETVRYYERIGLVPLPPRTAGGHRVYSVDLRKRLAFIRRSRELGFSIDEIRALLALGTNKKLSCGAVKTLTMQHLVEVRARITDLQRLEKTLAATARKCRGGDAPECPILDDLLGRAERPIA
jgi:MerR family mercuric resistance operon transcriptional regulator